MFNIFTKVKRYLKNVRAEFDKISWPSRDEIISLTILVLLMVVVLTFYVGGLDAIFSQLVRYLLGS